MTLNPPPIIATSLVLVTQPLLRSDMQRQALVTFALLSPGVAPTDLQDTLDDFQTNFNATFGTAIDTEVSILPPFGKMGLGTIFPLEAVAAGAAITGGAAALSIPPNCAVLFKKNTGVGGKQNRGRTYLPFCIDNSNVSENGTVAPATVSGFQTLANNFLTQLTTDGTPMVIANRVFNVPLKPHFVTHINVGPNVTSLKCESLIATQRRRLRS